MSQATKAHWESLRTSETQAVESILRNAGFEHVDAYRYNSVSIRVRVIGSRFEGLMFGQRLDLIEPHLEILPEETQRDILTIIGLTPVELISDEKAAAFAAENHEFEDPSPSIL